MSKEYKTSFKSYAAWNYQKEIEDLNKASLDGWQLVKGGCFHSKFRKNPDICYRYQLDYRKIEDMGRYIETFREQGWEYINSTFNGWHYFRKLYDPARPEEEYEIFTDRESLNEMNSRWARLALIIGTMLSILALIIGIRIFRTLTLPRLSQFLLLAIEGAVLIRGGLIMKNPDSSRSRKGEGVLLAVFFAVIILGCTAMIVLLYNRPNMTTSQQASSIDEPIIDSRWNAFKVQYPDNYYLDLDMKSDAPMTFSVLNEKNEVVFTKTGEDFHGKDIRLKLSRGTYEFSMSAETGFSLACSIE